MATRNQHLNYIASKGLFIVDCNKKIFSKEELELLSKYGHWFNALTSGELEPFTNQQMDFIMVARFNKLPITMEEKVWYKYLKRKQLETEDENKLFLQYHIEYDTFYKRDMAKKLRGMMYGVMKGGHYS